MVAVKASESHNHCSDIHWMTELRGRWKRERKRNEGRKRNDMKRCGSASLSTAGELVCARVEHYSLVRSAILGLLKH